MREAGPACRGALLLLGVALGVPQGALGQIGSDTPGTQLHGLHMTAEPSSRQGSINTSDSADYDVVLIHNITLTSEPVRLTALGVDGVEIQGVLVVLDGIVLVPLSFNRTAPDGGQAVFWETDMGQLTPGPERTLEVRYTVTGAYHDGARLTLPILVPNAAPPEPLPGVFESEIRLPVGDGSGMHVTASFPTDIRPNPVTSEGARREVTAELPVLPRFVRMELGRGAGSAWARLSVLESLAAFLIVVFGGLGWRHLQRSG